MTKTNAILNNRNTHTEGLRVMFEMHRTKGQQSADQNINTEGLRANTEKRNICCQQISGRDTATVPLVTPE